MHEKQAYEKYFSFDVIQFPRGFISHFAGLSHTEKESPFLVFILTLRLSKLHNKWHWSCKNPRISFHPKLPLFTSKRIDRPAGREWMPDAKYNFNGIAYRITCNLRIRHTDFISPSLVLTPIHCFIIIFLTRCCHKRLLNPLTRKHDRDRTIVRRVAERATGVRDRTQREKLINSFANNITRHHVYPYDIDYNCTAKVLFVIAWLPILPLSYGITRYTFYIYFRNSCMLYASFKIWNYVAVNINMRDVYIDSMESSVTVIP